MKNIIHLSILVALLVGATVLSAHAATTVAGQPELTLLQNILTGVIGKFVGLLVAFIGAITLVRGNSTFGITLIVLGILITMLPGVYNGVRKITCPIIEAIGANCGMNAQTLSQ